jgi:hypothetical protein
MKKVTALVFSILLTGFFSKAETTSHVDSSNYNYDGSAYIFVENGVEFSVFPDGQFDFVYLGYDRSGNLNININHSNVNVNYNSGYDYDVYVQYDDYGAVIQVENVEIYYDHYGRIIQAGNTEIHYNDRRIVRIGGMRVFYNHHGYFSHYTGYINFWTPYYVYRPWHVYYARPFYSTCIVYDYPYRMYYKPHRYSFRHHRQYYNTRYSHTYRNARRDFYRPGSRVHYRDGRVAKRRDFDPQRDNSYATANPRRKNTSIRSNTNIRNSKRSDLSTNDRGRTQSEFTARNKSVTKRNPVRNKKTETSRNSNRTINRATAVNSTKPSARSKKGTNSVRMERAKTNKRVAVTNRSNSIKESPNRNFRAKSASTSRKVSSGTSSRGTTTRKGKRF